MPRLKKTTPQKPPGPFPFLSRMAPWGLALGLGALGLWQFHNTEFLTSFGLVPGGRGDNRFVTSLLEYLYQAHRGYGQFLSPAFYYPTAHTLGYSDIYLTHALLYGWLRNLGLDLFTCYQVTVLVMNILTYLLGLWMLRWAFGFSVTSSAFGAFFFAFNCPKFNQISETQLQCLFWLALAAGLTVLFARKAGSLTPWNALLLLGGAALSLDFQLLTGFYLGWFFLFWTLLFLGLALLRRSTRSHLTGLLRGSPLPLAGAAVLFILGLIPFFQVYLPVLLDLGGKSYDEVRASLPHGWSFLWMGPRHAWWGWLWDRCPAIRSFDFEEGQRLGFGLVASVALIATTFQGFKVLLKKTGKTLSLSHEYAALAILSSILFCSLALDYGNFSPWYAVFKLIPGGQTIRVVSRFVIFLALPLSIVLTFFLDLLLQKAGASKKKLLPAGILLVAGIGVWEQIALPPYPAFDKKTELERLEYLSEKLPATAKVFYVAPAPALPVALPYSATNLQIDAMLLSAVRTIPTLNGYSGHSPKDNWGLFKVRSPKYEQYVKDWTDRHPLPGPAYRLEIDR